LFPENDYAPSPNISEALAEHMKDKRVPCHFDLARRLSKFYDDRPGELDCQLRRLHEYGLEHVLLNFGFGKFSSEKKHSGIRPDDQVLNAPTEDED